MQARNALTDPGAVREGIPLCVDLDQTLIRSDMLWESLVRLAGHRPWLLLLVPFWLLRGRAFLKRQLARRIRFNPAALPYNEPLLEFVRVCRQEGCPTVLVTACDILLAQPIADHVGVFDEVLASDGRRNLRGAAKADVLVQRYGARGFDYAGNSPVDLHVWTHSRRAIVVNAGQSLARRAATVAAAGPVFLKTTSTWRGLLQALRPHQWVKNLIVFIPPFAAHLFSIPSLVDAAIAFVAFCACASATYVANDLLDVEADRCHSLKCRRPFASGELSLAAGFVLFPSLLAGGIAVGYLQSASLAGVLVLYSVTTTAYSLALKRVPVLDVFVLAGLYTLRLIAGHVATRAPYSAWLLAFSMFIFLSLALVKRFKELQIPLANTDAVALGRGYAASDLEVVGVLGLVSGYMAVLVLALYVNSSQVAVLYRYPMLLLLVCPLLLYWITRIWLLTYRRQMHTDPVLFAVKDWPSYVIAALVLGVSFAAMGLN